MNMAESQEDGDIMEKGVLQFQQEASALTDPSCGDLGATASGIRCDMTTHTEEEGSESYFEWCFYSTHIIYRIPESAITGETMDWLPASEGHAEKLIEEQSWLQSRLVPGGDTHAMLI